MARTTGEELRSYFGSLEMLGGLSSNFTTAVQIWNKEIKGQSYAAWKEEPWLLSLKGEMTRDDCDSRMVSVVDQITQQRTVYHRLLSLSEFDRLVLALVFGEESEPLIHRKNWTWAGDYSLSRVCELTPLARKKAIESGFIRETREGNIVDVRAYLFGNISTPAPTNMEAQILKSQILKEAYDLLMTALDHYGDLERPKTFNSKRKKKTKRALTTDERADFYSWIEQIKETAK